MSLAQRQRTEPKQSFRMNNTNSVSYERAVPVLPRELEWDIFDIAAREDAKTAVCLPLVCRRAQIWVEPVIYGTVILGVNPKSTQSFMRAFENPSRTGFFSKHVKSLCLARHVDMEVACRVLSICTSITNLACWITPSSRASQHLLRLISRLTLNRLSLNLNTFSGSSGQCPLDLPLFKTITHLDVVNHWALWTTSGYDTLPSLTHIAFRFWPRGTLGDALKNLLRKCEKLEVLLLLADQLVMATAPKFLEDEGIDDPRVVLLAHGSDMGQWDATRRGEPDMWSNAEAIVKKQLLKAAATTYSA